MTFQVRLLIAVGLFTFAAETAMAADQRIPVLKAPVSPPVRNWNGWYAGLNAGAVWGDASVAWSAGPGFTPAGTSDIANTGQGHIRTLGFAGGGQAGYNVQFQSFVAGLEADLEYTGIDGTRSLLSSIFLNPYSQSVRSNWLSTARGRLGVVSGPWLLYGTGGLAIAQVNFADSFVGQFGAGPVNSTVTQTRLGWTAGGGAEMALALGWSARVEYLHADLGSINDLGINVITLASISHAHRLTEDFVRVGFNFRWGDAR